MKNYLKWVATLVLCGMVTTVHGQFGGPPGAGAGMMGGMPSGPSFNSSLDKLFGDNSSYSADLEFQQKGANGPAVTLPGKLSFDQGKTRFELDITKGTGTGVPADMAPMMKQMGMDSMVNISRPDKKVTYVVFPGLKAYAETAMSDADTAPADQMKMESTELGKETVDGHPCVKNKVTVTDSKAKKAEYTVWNATDLKKFPVKIESTEQGSTVTMLFKGVKFGKVEAALFDPPAGFAKYADTMTMMQQEMMKKMTGGFGQ